MKNDFYATLEVSPRASEEVVHSAYRALAVKHSANNSKLKRLNEAKEVLFDANRRKEYDDARTKQEKGKIIGNYKILSEIAEGGFGKTYLAEHIILGNQVCIKHAHRISAEDELLLKEEAKTIWDLRHFSIPNIRDIMEMPDGSFALVMSYVPGPTLAQIVEKHKKIDSEHVAWIAERVLNALKYLHFHGVVHGDVKPQNIIIQPESHTAVLVDYGLSAIRPRKDATNKGYTPFFAAPEQVNGGTILPETDLYGLGTSLIYALGGDVEAKKLPSTVPDGLFNLIKRLIVHNVLDRPNWSKEDLMETIQNVRNKDFGRRSSAMKPLIY